MTGWTYSIIWHFWVDQWEGKQYAKIYKPQSECRMLQYMNHNVCKQFTLHKTIGCIGLMGPNPHAWIAPVYIGSYVYTVRDISPVRTYTDLDLNTKRNSAKMGPWGTPVYFPIWAVGRLSKALFVSDVWPLGRSKCGVGSVVSESITILWFIIEMAHYGFVAILSPYNMLVGLLKRCGEVLFKIGLLCNGNSS